MELWREALQPGEPAGAALRAMRVAALAGSGDCRTLFVHAGECSSPQPGCSYHALNPKGLQIKGTLVDFTRLLWRYDAQDGDTLA